MNEQRQSSSDGESTGAANPEATRSIRVSGSEEFSGWYHYIAVRESLTPTQLYIQAMHAARDNGALWVHCEMKRVSVEGLYVSNPSNAALPMPPQDTRIAFLVVTKARMAQLLVDLDASGIPYIQNKEISGDLAGMITSVSFMTNDKAKVEPFTSHLPKAKLMRVQVPEEK